MNAQKQPSSSTDVPLLTFNSLYGILREEKKSKVLQSLPELFYEGLDTFFSSKKEEVQKLKGSTDTDKFSKEKRIYLNSKKIAEELIGLRLSKISNSAVKSGFFDDSSYLPESILERERDFFESVSLSSSKVKKSLI